MSARRAGQTGRVDFQGRIHFGPGEDPEDRCGEYRLLECVGPGTWRVEWTAPCDIAYHAAGHGHGATSVLRFVSRAEYDEMF